MSGCDCIHCRALALHERVTLLRRTVRVARWARLAACAAPAPLSWVNVPLPVLFPACYAVAVACHALQGWAHDRERQGMQAFVELVEPLLTRRQ